MTHFTYRAVRLREWPLLLALLCCDPLSYWIPRDWSWENGPIENLQLAVLLGGCALAGIAWLRMRGTPVGMLARCAVPLWAILAAREVSWGADFMAPLWYSDEGPYYSSSTLSYKFYIMPALALVLAWPLWTAWRHRLDLLLGKIFREGGFPWLAIAVVLAAAIATTSAESHFKRYLLTPNAQGFEELAELTGYAALFVAQAYLLLGYACAPVFRAMPEEPARCSEAES